MSIIIQVLQEIPVILLTEETRMEYILEVVEARHMVTEHQHITLDGKHKVGSEALEEEDIMVLAETLDITVMRVQ
jgi:hypothetical protein